MKGSGCVDFLDSGPQPLGHYMHSADATNRLTNSAKACPFQHVWTPAARVVMPSINGVAGCIIVESFCRWAPGALRAEGVVVGS